MTKKEELDIKSRSIQATGLRLRDKYAKELLEHWIYWRADLNTLKKALIWADEANRGRGNERAKKRCVGLEIDAKYSYSDDTYTPDGPARVVRLEYLYPDTGETCFWDVDANDGKGYHWDGRTQFHLRFDDGEIRDIIDYLDSTKTKQPKPKERGDEAR